MGRIVMLVLGFGLSCLLVTGLLSFTEGFGQTVSMELPTQIPLLSVQEDPQESMLQFPAPVPGTSLTAQRLICYEGPFLEDSSDRPVKNIVALVLCNTGSSMVEEASVVLERAGELYEFHLTYILPGMSVMALESSAAAYVRQGITGACGWEKTAEEDAGVLPGLQITALDMGRLSVTNVTDHELKSITLFHKNFLPDGTFVGGITYLTDLGTLAPGETVEICPDHYAEGYSKIFYAE